MKISSQKFQNDCKRLALFLKEKNVKKLHGVPKNGLIVVQELKNIYPNLFEIVYNGNGVTNETWIIDDLIDSGKTLSKFLDNKKAVLYIKNIEQNKSKVEYGEEVGNEWIDFFFEDKEKDFEEIFVRKIEMTGESILRKGLLKTPMRARKAWQKMTEGYEQNPKEIMTVFRNESNIDQIVGLSNIQFYSHCEHHLVPFFGKAHVFYIPDKKIVGVSKLARITDLYARRLQNQERLAKNIADCLEEELKPKALAVILEGQHLCMLARGVEKEVAIMKTSDLRGFFRTDAESRQELFNLIK